MAGFLFMARPKKLKKEYKLELTTGGQTYEAEGVTLVEAINAIPLTWLDIKYKGMIKARKGDQTFERFFYPKQLKLLFGLNKFVKIKIANDIERCL